MDFKTSWTTSRRAMLGAAALLLGTLLACGGGADRSKANLRFVNASSGYAALDLYIDDKRRFEAIGYGESATYAETEPDQMASGIHRTGSASPLLTLAPAVTKDKHFTLLAYGREGALASLLIDDNAEAADSGKAKLRIVNAAPDAGELDVYLTAANEPLTGAVPLRASVAVGVLSDFSTLNSGDWRLRITGAGDRTDLRLDLPGITLATRVVSTLVLTPTTGGVLVNALMLNQQAAITRHPVQHARVRAAAPNNGTMQVSVRGVPLLNAVAAPVVGAYQLLPVGEQPVTVSIDGAPLTLPNVTLAAGTELTLLVYADLGVPAAIWLIDDNRPPVSTSQAKLRLVHGRDGLGGALSLKVDFLPVSGEIALAGASAYTTVLARDGARITVSQAGDAAPVFEATDQSFVAGAVYSVFVIDGVAPAAGFLRRDR